MSIFFQSCDVINAYSYAFQFACNIQPSFSTEKKSLRLALIDSLCEQAFGGTMILGTNQEYYWKENNSINVRINDLHKSAAFFYYGDRKLDLPMVKRSLTQLKAKFAENHLISKKAKALLEHVRFVTSTWQADAIKFLKNLVSYFSSISVVSDRFLMTCHFRTRHYTQNSIMSIIRPIIRHKVTMNTKY